MPYGWTQSLKNWTITKSNQDTVITYNFTKEEFMNLRMYVTELERDSKLYKINEIELLKKDSIIENKQLQIMNKDSIIEFKDTIISIHTTELKKLDEQFKVEQELKIKFQKQATTIPYWLGGGGVLGFILCLLLTK